MEKIQAVRVPGAGVFRIWEMEKAKLEEMEWCGRGIGKGEKLIAAYKFSNGNIRFGECVIVETTFLHGFFRAASIGYFVKPEHRNRNWGKLIVRNATDRALSKYPMCIAYVRAGNIASRKVLEHAGYRKVPLSCNSAGCAYVCTDSGMRLIYNQQFPLFPLLAFFLWRAFGNIMKIF